MLRIRGRLVGLTLAVLLLVFGGTAAFGGASVQKRTITLYQDGPANVVRLEKVELERGTNQLTRYIPGKARTNTVFLDSPAGTVRSVEVVPPVAGERATLREQLGEVLEVKVESGEDPWIEGELVDLVDGGPLLETSSGRFRLIRDPKEYRFSGQLPTRSGNGLRVRLDSKKTGESSLSLGYQVEGLGWSPRYVGFLNEEEGELRLRGLAQVENATDWDFEEAKVYLLAGSPAREERGGERLLAASNQVQAESGPEQVFEYYRYPIDFPLQLEGRSEVVVEFMEERTVDYRRYYRFEPSASSAVRSFLVLENEEEAGLGLPLASGPVRLHEDDEERSFIGADSLPKLPEGATAELDLGETFDLEGERTRKVHERLGEESWRDRVEVVLTNGKEVSADVRLVERLPGSWKVTRSSQDYERVDSNRIRFDVEVPPDGSAEVSYTVEYGY